MRSLGQDVRHALRVFGRAPFFHAGIVLTLALGIGANGAVFSILRAVLLQPLPYHDADRVVMVWESQQHPPVGQQNEMLAGPAWRRGYLSGGMIAALRQESKDVFSDIAALIPSKSDTAADFDLVLSDRAERLHGALATPNFFDLLGVKAARGRLFAASDEQSPEPVVVLSDALWRSAFGADPSIVGRHVPLIAGSRPRMSRTFTVIGVLPPAFRFSYPDETQLWALESWQSIGQYGQFAICCEAIARLNPGVPFDRAAARMAAIRTGVDNPGTALVFRMERIYDWVVGETRPSLLLLGAVALLLLAITCATTANALLVRIAERRRELAVRASLGASRARLVRQLLVEGALLAAVGAAAGTLTAAFIAPVVRSLMPTVVPRADEIGVSGWMLLFGIGAAALVTLVAAVAPAWQGAREDPAPALKSASSTASADRTAVRWREAMVAAQVAIAIVLVISAALLLVSFWRLGRVPVGFDGAHVLTVEMRLDNPQYRGTRTADGALAPSPALEVFRRNLVQRVRALPGVLDAGITSAVPFRGTDYTYVLNPVGETRQVVGNARFVDAGYFEVMRIALLRGRIFSSTDTARSHRVAVVSESYAREMFGAEDPIGRRIDREGSVEIVGVVGDVRYVARDRAPQPAIYFPAVQGPSLLVCLVARVAPNAGDLGQAVRGVIHDLDAAQPAMNMTTIDQIVNESVANRRFYTTATGAFAAVALILTLVGLVVIVARSVVERRRELAIRSALGASSGGIVGLVARQSLTPVLTGAGLGLAAAYIGSSVLAQFLFQVAPHAPVIYAGAALLIFVVAAIAVLAPARRAADVEPAAVLRAE